MHCCRTSWRAAPPLPSRLGSLVIASLLAVFALPATAATPALLANLNDAPTADRGSDPILLATLADGRAVFSAADSRHGREPWVTDGTPEGTHLIADLVPGPSSSLALVREAVSAGDHVFILAETLGADVPRGWWATDGTAAGTHLLVGGLRTNFFPFDISSLHGDATGRAFLLAQDPALDPGLWVSDGSVAGTRRLALPGLPQRNAGGTLADLGERLLFVSGTGIGGSQELWASDGSNGGTRRLAPGPVAGPALGPSPAVGIVDPAFRAVALDDGTAVILQDLGSPFYSERTALADWGSDGTPAGTHRVATLEGYLLHGAVTAGPRAAFCVDDVESSPRLWWSDGTSAGTRAPLAPDTGCPAYLRWLGDRLLYARRGALRALDEGGTETLLVDPPGGIYSPLLPFRGGVAFLVGASAGENELWWSDGSVAGTRRLANLGPRDDTDSLIGSYTLGDGREVLLLSLGRGDGTWDLFAADGQEGPPVRLTTIGLPEHRLTAASGFQVLPAGDRLLFSLDDGVHGLEPWVSDATPAGTGLLTNVSAAEGDGDGFPYGFERYGDDLLFFACDAVGWGLWRSDGTAGGTRLLLRLDLSAFRGGAAAFSRPAAPLALAGDHLYFTLPSTQPSSVDLVVVDLTVPRLRHLGDLAIYDSSSGEDSARHAPVAKIGGGGTPFPGPPAYAVAVGENLLWSPGHFEPLVFSDGTAAGTRTLPLRTLSGPAPLAALDEEIGLVAGYTQTAEGGVDEVGLWRTDGTAGGTHRILASHVLPYLEDLTPRTDGTVAFAYGGDGASQASGLWCSDGTAEGTTLLEPFSGQPPSDLVDTPQGLFFFYTRQIWLRPAGASGSHPLTELTPEGKPLLAISAQPFNSGIFFTGLDPLAGAEPWVSDGTVAGTRRLGDLVPGSAGCPYAATFGDGQAFFQDAGALWRTDGTPDGTFPVLAANSTPTADGDMAVVGGRLVFAGFDFTTGREPWWLPTGGLTPPPPAPPPAVPAAPGDLRAVSGPVSVKLTWTPPAGLVRSYQVEVRLPGIGDFQHFDTVSGSPFSVDGLAADYPYVFRVRAVNESGVSPPSAEVTASRVSTPPQQCGSSDGVLCLLGGRFAVSAWWRDPRSGDFGRARAEPLPGNDLSGTFWFFRDGNVELIVKALDGTAVNRRWWIFAGGLTDVEYWLRAIDLSVTETDPAAAVTWYHHPSGDLCGFADTDAFAGEPGLYFPLPAAASAAEPAPGYLDLLGGRYRVSVEWRDPRSGDTGVGHAVSGSDGSGYFWFFRPDNVELVVKVLDGTPVNGHRWVFYGGLTDVEYTLRVEDLLGDEARTYDHPAGNLCGGADTTAFAAPPPP